MIRLIAISFSGLIVMAVASGCGSRPALGHVFGTVTLKGQPLSSGSVILVTADGQKKGGAISAAGKYSIRDVPIGRARVTVFNHPAVPIPPLPEPGRPAAPPQKDAPQVVIPRRFQDPDKSGLVCQVTSGSQEFPIELNP